MHVPDVSGLALQDLVSLQGRVAVVTGGGRGIGAAIADRLAEAGATVVVADRDRQTAEARVEEIRDRHGSAPLARPLDIAAPDGAAELAGDVRAELGRLDIWVNNAGVFPKGGFLDLTAEDWDVVQRVNARGAFLGAQAAAREMMAAGQGGAIVNIASVAGLRGGWPGYSHYVASKHAVIGLTKSLASELGPHGIRAVGVAPSAIDTAGVRETFTDDGALFRDFTTQLPVGRAGVPDDISRVVLFLASDLAAFMTGTTVVVDGGATAR